MPSQRFNQRKIMAVHEELCASDFFAPRLKGLPVQSASADGFVFWQTEDDQSYPQIHAMRCSLNGSYWRMMILVKYGAEHQYLTARNLTDLRKKIAEHILAPV